MEPGDEGSGAFVSKGVTDALLACGVDWNALSGSISGFLDIEQEGFWASALGARGLQRAAALVSEHAGDPRLGLRLAFAVPARSLGIVEYLMRTANSVRHALELNQEFSALVFDFLRLELEERQGARVVRVIAPEGLTLEPLLVDYRLGRLLFHTRGLLGDPDLSPLQVHLTYPRPPALTDYHQLFGRDATLRFEQPVPEIYFALDVHERPLPGRDPFLNGILRQHARRMLDERSRIGTTASRVEQELTVTLHQRKPSAGEVARRLHLSERTLRRRLAEEGTTFAELVDRVRASLAALHLRAPDATAESVASLLGFESASAFRRAHKRWKQRRLIED